MSTAASPFFARKAIRRAGVVVVSAGGTLHLLAARPFRAGEEVLRLAGRVVDAPTRFTVELGEGRHLDATPSSSDRERMERSPWLFLNHACEPNTRLAGEDGRSLLALEDIAVGDELSFDYEANESHMAEPFVCACGACDGRLVRGYAWLTEEERARRQARLSPHLRTR